MADASAGVAEAEATPAITIRLTGASITPFGFGAPFAAVDQELRRQLGPPADDSRGPDDSLCPARTLRWGGLRVSFANGGGTQPLTLSGWGFNRAGDAEGSVGPDVATEDGLTLGSPRDDVEALLPPGRRSRVGLLLPGRRPADRAHRSWPRCGRRLPRRRLQRLRGMTRRPTPRTVTGTSLPRRRGAPRGTAGLIPAAQLWSSVEVFQPDHDSSRTGSRWSGDRSPSDRSGSGAGRRSAARLVVLNTEEQGHDGPDRGATPD